MALDFAQKSALRKFELIVEGKSLFVNKYFLAELSPYFYALCFSDTFEESRQGRAVLKGIAHPDMLELLRSVCPDENFALCPRITGALINSIRLSSRAKFCTFDTFVEPAAYQEPERTPRRGGAEQLRLVRVDPLR